MLCKIADTIMLASLTNTLDEELPVGTEFILEQSKWVIGGIQGLGKRFIAASGTKKAKGLLAAIRKFNHELSNLSGALYAL